MKLSLLDLFKTFSVLCLSYANAYAMESSPQLIQESQLVFCHTTDIFPFPIMRVGGQINKTLHVNSANEITKIEKEDQSLWPPLRVTLHWGLNAAIPPSDTVVKYEGKQLPVPAIQRYGVIEPFGELKDQIYGGYVRDFYSIGQHTLSDRAMLFVPQNEFDDIFAAITKDFKGIIIGYDYQPQRGQHAGWAIDTYLMRSQNIPYLTNEIKISLYDFSRKYGPKGRVLYDDYQDFDTLDRNITTVFGKLVKAQKEQPPSGLAWALSLFTAERDTVFLHIRYTVGEYRDFRQLHFSNGINTTEKEFLAHMKTAFSWDLKEPGLYHVESKFCELENDVYAALFHGMGKKELQDKLNRYQIEISEQSEKAGAAFHHWRLRVLEWMDKSSQDRF